MDHGEVNMSFDRGLQKEGEDLSEPAVLTTCFLPSSSTISPTLDDNHLVAPSSSSATATDLEKWWVGSPSKPFWEHFFIMFDSFEKFACAELE